MQSTSSQSPARSCEGAANFSADLASILGSIYTGITVLLRAQGACELDNGDLLLVTEFMEGGDLHSALRRGAVSWRRRWTAGRLVRGSLPLRPCCRIGRDWLSFNAVAIADSRASRAVLYSVFRPWLS